MFFIDLEQDKKRDLDEKYMKEKQRFDNYVQEQKKNRDKMLKEIDDKRTTVRNQFFTQ